jgi:hypothetical protein
LIVLIDTRTVILKMLVQPRGALRPVWLAVVITLTVTNQEAGCEL